MEESIPMFLAIFICALVALPTVRSECHGETLRDEYSVSVEEVIHPLSIVIVTVRIYQAATPLPLPVDEFPFVPSVDCGSGLYNLLRNNLSDLLIIIRITFDTDAVDFSISVNHLHDDPARHGGDIYLTDIHIPFPG